MTISMSIFREGYSSHAARPAAEKGNQEYRKKSEGLYIYILTHSKMGRHTTNSLWNGSTHSEHRQRHSGHMPVHTRALRIFAHTGNMQLVNCDYLTNPARALNTGNQT